MTVIDRFHQEYDSFNDISQSRARERVRLLHALEAFAGVPILQTDDTHMRAFLGKLVTEGFHPNTVTKKRNMIMPFYGWAFDDRLISGDVLMRLKRVKNPRGTVRQVPRPYDRKEILAFWADLDASWPVAKPNMLVRWQRGTSRYKKVSSHLMRAQINAIAHLALHAGMRRDEIFNASLDDIHYDNAYVVVRHAARKNPSATSRPREVPMTVGLSNALKEWLELRAELLSKAPKRAQHDSPWLCLAANQSEGVWFQPMRHQRFAALMSTLGRGYELHRLRHTCGTEWLRGGLPLEQVKELLGHSRIQQTLAYAEIVKTDLEKGMGKVAADFETAVGRAA